MALRLAKLLAFSALTAASAALSGCITPSAGANGLYAAPIGNAPVTANPTAYTPALRCLSAYAQAHNIPAPRIAVGRILDYTGAVTEDGGRRITQGGSLMAMSAFANAGARLVERFDTSVSELELRYANSRLIGEAQGAPVRSITAGQIPGSDYYFVGGVTELNYNIRSNGVDAFGGGSASRDDRGSFTGRLYVMNIGLDFRLVDTRTLEVVDVVSYQKQIIGREVRAGVFSFFNDNLIDLSAGARALEPMQLAVRAGVERATVEVMANLYGVGGTDVCSEELRAAGDPMGPSQGARAFQGAAHAAAPEAMARRTQQGAWHTRRDPNMRPAPAGDLRGRRAEAAPREIGPEANAAPARTPGRS